jgi:cytochrome b561
MSFVTSAYSVTASYFHWFVAVPMFGCVGAVLKAQQAPKEDKPGLMNLHKSLGLLTGMIVAPRVAYRILNRAAVSREKKMKTINKLLDPEKFVCISLSFLFGLSDLHIVIAVQY